MMIAWTMQRNCGSGERNGDGEAENETVKARNQYQVKKCKQQQRRSKGNAPHHMEKGRGPV
eukprot:7768175-Prorocentrum_lima.AAC.1